MWSPTGTEVIRVTCQWVWESLAQLLKAELGQMLSAGAGSSSPCASLAAFGARPFGSCGDPAAFQGSAAAWRDGMAAPLQQPVQLVVTANGNVWGLFIKCVREQTKGQLCSCLWGGLSPV